MRGRCARGELVEAVTAAYHATTVPQAPDVIRLRLQRGSLEVEGQNYGYQVARTIPADVEQPGDVFIPARLFHGIVHAISGDAIQLALDRLHLTIAGNLQELAIRTVDASYSLQVEDRATEFIGTSTLAQLQRAVQRVRFVCPREPVSPALEGALLDLVNARLRLVATDGLRVAVASAVLSSAGDGPLSTVVPVRTLDEILRLSRAGDDPTVDLRASSNRAQLSFSGAGFRLRTAVIGQQFPNVDAFMSASTSTDVTLDRAGLLEVLEAAAFLATGQYRQIQIECDAVQAVVTCSTSGPDGRQRAVMPAKVLGPSAKVAMHCEFLRQGVVSINTETMQMQLSEQGPCVLRHPDSTFDRYILGLLTPQTTT